MAAPVQDVYMYLIKKTKKHLAEGENCKTHLNRYILNIQSVVLKVGFLLSSKNVLG